MLRLCDVDKSDYLVRPSTRYVPGWYFRAFRHLHNQSHTRRTNERDNTLVLTPMSCIACAMNKRVRSASEAGYLHTYCLDHEDSWLN